MDYFGSVAALGPVVVLAAWALGALLLLLLVVVGGKRRPARPVTALAEPAAEPAGVTHEAHEVPFAPERGE